MANKFHYLPFDTERGLNNRPWEPDARVRRALSRIRPVNQGRSRGITKAPVRSKRKHR